MGNYGSYGNDMARVGQTVCDTDSRIRLEISTAGVEQVIGSGEGE
jgi:hypothetical protein